MIWRIIDSKPSEPNENMQKDAMLLNSIAHSPPTIHFYQWNGDAATYGYFTNPEDHLNREAIRQANLKLARRPTGGGIIFHLSDLTYSILIPATHSCFSMNTLDNYQYVNRKIANAIALFSEYKLSPQLLTQGSSTSGNHFCMAQPTIFDILIEGKKVGGAAQRRTKEGFLHQGSIILGLPYRSYLEKILKQESVLESMFQISYPLLGAVYTFEALRDARRGLRECIIKSFVEAC